MQFGLHKKDSGEEDRCAVRCSWMYLKLGRQNRSALNPWPLIDTCTDWWYERGSVGRGVICRSSLREGQGVGEGRGDKGRGGDGHAAGAVEDKLW